MTGDRGPGGPDQDTAPVSEPAALREVAIDSGPEPGERVGRYVVDSCIAGGGMGLVYRARDPDLGRAVAIKILQPEHAAEEGEVARLRLLREAQALARLSHPNIIAVYDVGRWQASVFVALELIEGPTLKQWLEQARREPRAILEVFREAGRALAATHSAGLVHRDFKPSNVMIGKDGRVRVLDFGLARAQKSAPAELAGRPAEPRPDRLLTDDITTAGDIAGTPAFMSPEQHLGQAVDARADQFSFCAALYWALYRELPFPGKSNGEVRQAVLDGRMRPWPSAPRAPARLRRLIVRGLARSADDRHVSMEALLRELDAVLRPTRRLIAVAMIAVAAIGVATVAVVRGRGAGLCRGLEREMAAVWNPAAKQSLRDALVGTGRANAPDTALRVSQKLDEYASAWVRMRVDACEATNLRGVQSQRMLDLRMACLSRAERRVAALIGVLTRQPDGDVVDKAIHAAQSLPQLESCADETALLAAVPPPDDPELRARVDALQAEIASVQAQLDTGRFHDGVAAATALLARAESVGHAPTLAQVEYLLGSLQDESGQTAEARETLSRAAKRAAEAKDDALAAHAWTRLVNVIGIAQARHDDAILIAQMADAAIARAGRPPLVEAELLVNEAGIALESGKYGDAEALYRRAVALVEKAGPAGAARLPVYRNSLAAAIASQGRYEDARVLFEGALADEERIYGPDHPAIGKLLQNLGLLYERMGQWERSRATLERALRIYERTAGPDHPRVAGILNNLAGTLSNLGHEDESIEALRRAVRIWSQPGQPERPDLCYALASLATSLVNRGDFAEAREVAQKALVRFEKVFGPNHPDVAFALATLGDIHYRGGSYKEAEALLRRAIDLRQREKGDPRLLASNFVSLAAVLEHRGRLDEALALLDRVLALAGGNAEEAAATSAADGETPVLVASALEVRSGVRVRMGQPRAASEDGRRALAMREKIGGPRHPATAGALVRLGEALAAEGRAAEAVTALSRAAEILPRRHPDLPLALIDLAAAQMQEHQAEAAGATLGRAFALPAMAVQAAEERARASFLLARASADGARSVALAREADDLFAHAEDGNAPKARREVRRWLAARLPSR